MGEIDEIDDVIDDCDEEFELLIILACPECCRRRPNFCKILLEIFELTMKFVLDPSFGCFRAQIVQGRF